MRGILTYHSVDPSGSPISIDEAVFRAHVAWLAAGAVRVVPLERIAGENAPEDAVALTFDDGFANFASVAWPLLRAHGLPVTLFVVTGRVGMTNDWGDTGGRGGVPILPLMDWDALGRVAEEGGTLGAHSRTHPDLRTLDGAALEDEVGGSAAALQQRTGVRPASFAYPYGGVSGKVQEAVGRIFSLAVTTELRELGNGEQALRLPRLDAYYYREPGRLEAWGSGAFLARLRLRAALRRTRAALTGRPA